VSRNPHKFKYAEAARLLKVGQNSGFRKPILELDSATGRLSIRDGDCDGDKATNQSGNPWDKVTTNHDDPNKKRTS
jgi:hypothetical protein